jgi:Protein of unknown function (DUF3006)
LLILKVYRYITIQFVKLTSRSENYCKDGELNGTRNYRSLLGKDLCWRHKGFPKSALPKGAKVGDMLIIDGNTITISKEGTKQLRKEIDDLMDELFED